LDDLRIAGGARLAVCRNELVPRGSTHLSSDEVTLNHKPQNAISPQDRSIFSDAARQFQIWIVVHQTNPASMKYVYQVRMCRRASTARLRRRTMMSAANNSRVWLQIRPFGAMHFHRQDASMPWTSGASSPANTGSTLAGRPSWLCRRSKQRFAALRVCYPERKLHLR